MRRTMVNRSHVIAVFLVGLLLTSAALSGANADSEEKSSSDGGDMVSSEGREAEILRAQLEVRRQHQSELLDTVYWALGGVFVLVSLLVGFGWFGNFKVYERDKQSLKDELDAAVKSHASELHDDLQKACQEFRSEIDSAVETRVNARIGSIERQIKKVEARVFQIELARAKESMYSKSSDNMALTSALNLLGECYKSVEHEVPELLKFIAEKLDGGGKFTAEEHTRMTDILDDLPSRYTTLAERVRKKMNDSDIF